MVPGNGPPGTLGAVFVAGGAREWTTGHAGGHFRRRWCREVDHRARWGPFSSPVVPRGGPPGTLGAVFVAGGAERWTTGHAGGHFRRRWCREVDHRAQLTAGDTLSPFDRLRDRLRDRREIPGQAGHDGKSMSSTGPSTGSGTARDARLEPGMTKQSEPGMTKR